MSKNLIIVGRVFRNVWKYVLYLLFVATMVQVAPEAQSATLNWKPNTEPNLAGYKVYTGTQSGVYTQKQDVGNVTSNAVSGLTRGLTYYFAVTAYNTDGAESDYSSEVSYILPNITNATPTIGPVANITLAEDAGSQTISLSGISSGATNETQTLTVSAVSSNPSLVSNPTVTYTSPAATGTISFTPLPNASGLATITVTVNDGQTTNNTATRSFTVTVTPVNDPPAISILPAQILVNKNTNAPMPGLSVSDPDAGSSNLLLHLTVQKGILRINTTVAGGLNSSQVISNNSPDVWITATVTAMNATLANTTGLVYLGNSNYVGGDVLTATINDNGNTGSGGALARTATLNITILGDALDSWRTQFFSQTDLTDPTKQATVWGDSADPDRDGRDNLMEFALGLDPLKKDAGAAALTVSTVDQTGSKYATLTFRRRQNDPLLQYVPEVSSDGQVWSSGASAVKELRATSIDSNFEKVVCQDLTPILPSGPRYFRLRVVKNNS